MPQAVTMLKVRMCWCHNIKCLDKATTTTANRLC